MSEELGNNGLRCRPGDLARIKVAWNELLLGRLVLVQRHYSHDRWMTLLLDDPALTLSEDYQGYVATKRLIAKDSALVPLSGQEAMAALLAIRTIAQACPNQERAGSPV